MVSMLSMNRNFNTKRSFSIFKSYSLDIEASIQTSVAMSASPFLGINNTQTEHAHLHLYGLPRTPTICPNARYTA